MARYQTIKKFAEESGYTERAIRTKIQDGTWPIGQVWIKAPDNRVLISVEGYEEWVESGTESGERLRLVSKSASCSRASSAGSASRLSPPPLT